MSPTVSNIFMADFEAEALESFQGESPRKWFRYVDDVIAVVKRLLIRIQTFLDHLNNRHGNIQFTVEVEKEGSLPIMDVLLHHEENGKVSVQETDVC